MTPEQEAKHATPLYRARCLEESTTSKPEPRVKEHAMKIKAKT